MNRTSGTGLVDPHEMAALWESRKARWTEARGTPHHLTPTMLSRQGQAVTRDTTCARQDMTIGRLAGVVVHRLLERWDFSQDPSGLSVQVAAAIQLTLEPDDRPHVEAVSESVNDLLRPSVDRKFMHGSGRPRFSAAKSRSSCRGVIGRSWKESSILFTCSMESSGSLIIRPMWYRLIRQRLAPSTIERKAMSIKLRLNRAWGLSLDFTVCFFGVQLP